MRLRTQTLATRCQNSGIQHLQGTLTVNGQAQLHSVEPQPYVRPSRFELEPTVFAAAVVAVVMSICSWNPTVGERQQQQAAPTDTTHTVAQAPRS